MCELEYLDAREFFVDFCPHFLVKKVHVKSKVCRPRTVGGSVILKVGSCFFVITAEQNQTYVVQVRIDARSFFVNFCPIFMSKVRFTVGGHFSCSYLA